MMLSILCVSARYSLSLVWDTSTSYLNSNLFLGLPALSFVPISQSVPHVQPEGACLYPSKIMSLFRSKFFCGSHCTHTKPQILTVAHKTPRDLVTITSLTFPPALPLTHYSPL